MASHNQSFHSTGKLVEQPLAIPIRFETHLCSNSIVDLTCRSLTCASPTQYPPIPPYGCCRSSIQLEAIIVANFVIKKPLADKDIVITFPQRLPPPCCTTILVHNLTPPTCRNSVQSKFAPRYSVPDFV